MYNGNIHHIVTHNYQLDKNGEGPLGYAYTYDQLHRIKQMEAWNNFDVATYAWSSGGGPLPKYSSQYRYDANGNLLELDRNGHLASAGMQAEMDELAYSYVSGANLLDQVNDLAGATAQYGHDFEGLYTFGYDDSGNLIEQDANGSVTALSWSPYGKVLEIADVTNDGTTAFTYGPDQNRWIKEQVTVSVEGESSKKTYYIRDAQGNVLTVYELLNGDRISWKEQHLYGSSRLGVFTPLGAIWTPQFPIGPRERPFYEQFPECMGCRKYEVTNHLGNVMATVRDVLGFTGSDDPAECSFPIYFEPVIASANEYYPFGSVMPGREYFTNNYRYGFNGKEADRNGEWGDLTHYD